MLTRVLVYLTDSGLRFTALDCVSHKFPVAIQFTKVDAIVKSDSSLMESTSCVLGYMQVGVL